MLSLYYVPDSCATVPYIALTEAGAPFETRVINFRRGEHLKDEYLRVNPKHKVPVLLIDGEPLTENVAILQWIAHCYPQSQLLPSSDRERFRAIAMLAWCASGIHTALTPNAVPQRYCDLPGSEDSVRRCAQKLLMESYRIAEQLLTGREWFFDGFTLPDAYFFWCFRRGLNLGIDLSSLPNGRAHFERVLRRPSVQKLVAFEAEALAALQGAG